MQRALPALPPERVSIPFIAGQWSLHAVKRADERTLVGFQSPSLRGSGRFVSGIATALTRAVRFNPLHCGAVVASWGELRRAAEGRRVSIPFIAGQWSLQMSIISHPFLLDVGFNPLHCGAVVASNNNNRVPAAPRRAFQSPSLRGSGRFNLIAPRRMAEGQGFQSPSLRGSGRFDAAFAPFGAAAEAFQSPSLRGSGRFPTGTCSVGRRSWGFNPLHCGAVVASS